MKFEVVVTVSLMSLAPALAKSVPQGARPAAPTMKLGYNAADPNLAAHTNARTGSSAIQPIPPGMFRQAAGDFPLQNLGVVRANLLESRPSPANTFFSFPRSTNPVGSAVDGLLDQKKAK